jgi:hypothetical protein
MHIAKTVAWRAKDFFPPLPAGRRRTRCCRAARGDADGLQRLLPRARLRADWRNGCCFSLPAGQGPGIRRHPLNVIHFYEPANCHHHSHRARRRDGLGQRGVVRLGYPIRPLLTHMS